MKITLNQDNRDVLDFECYPQHLLSVVSNKITSISSNQYLSQFGFGHVEMRVLASIAYRPHQKAVEVCALISIDKAAASRAITQLADAGFLVGVTESPKGKQKRWSLSEAGWELHERFLKTVIARNTGMTKGINEKELEAFTQTMQKLMANLSQMEQKLV